MAMPENQKGGDFNGSTAGGVQTSAQTSAQIGAGTLTEQDVATRYGLSTDQVHAFCHEFSVPSDGGQYVIPPAMLPRLESWAEQKGYPISKS